MSDVSTRYVYGPVPSKRLGRSLGIDLVPFKTCSYDCVYCQLGRTTDKTIQRKQYVAADAIIGELEQRLTSVERPDYISLAGSGEPTLNSDIGDLIGSIKKLTDIPVAVLTNGSLLWMQEVQDALMGADVVLPSLDAGDEGLFERVNRPHPDIPFERMVDGLTTFTRRFPGEVWLEALLLRGITGTAAEAAKIAALVELIGPARVQLNTAWRPPAEADVHPLSMGELTALAALFPGGAEVVGSDIPEESGERELAHARDADILALVRRRPCTAADVAVGLGVHVTEALKHLEVLVSTGVVAPRVVEGRVFYAPPADEGMF
jgi:wyosine [tRNA(Phe)-imidazoG37] synthetase (radical SAM superfamily)